MSTEYEFYIGEILLVAGHYAPEGCKACDGQQLGIRENLPLYTVIGTRYGGDGKSFFKLPDLQERILCGFHPDPTSEIWPTALGQPRGWWEFGLKEEHLPPHCHNLTCQPQEATASTPCTAEVSKLTLAVEVQTYDADATSVLEQMPGNKYLAGGRSAAGQLANRYVTPAVAATLDPLRKGQLKGVEVDPIGPSTLSATVSLPLTLAPSTAETGRQKCTFSAYPPTIALMYVIVCDGVYPA